MASLSPTRRSATAPPAPRGAGASLATGNGHARRVSLDLSPLLQAWPSEAPPALRRLATKLANAARGPLRTAGDRRWLARIVETAAESETPGLTGVYESLVWAHALGWLRTELPAGAVQELFDRLRKRTQRWPREGASRLDVTGLLACTELPLALAADRSLDEARALGSRGVAALENWCAEVSRLGAAPERLLPWMPLLAASWLRSRELIARGGLPADAAALDRGVILVREGLRALRRDGRALFGRCAATASDRRRWAEDAAPLDGGLPRVERMLAGGRAARARGALPASSISSEDAGTSILRNSWHGDSHAVATRVADTRFEAELLAAGVPLLSGAWQTRVAADGVPLEPAGVWEHVCFESDEEGDYLEYGLDLAGGWSIERFLFLPRNEGLCLAADALLGERPADVTYELSMPLADGVSFEPERETHEGRLGPARVLPLALPEWRGDRRRHGELASSGGALVHRAAARGARHLFPLWIDLDRSRRNREATWRRLTVAEDRAICSEELVVAFRVQVGKRQWLLYRSLGERGNRTVLGQNLVYELTVGRLNPEGELEKLVEIE